MANRYRSSNINQHRHQLIRSGDSFIHNNSPGHELHKNNDLKKTFECSGCKMTGIGSHYVCRRCRFTLHNDCCVLRPVGKTFYRNPDNSFTKFSFHASPEDYELTMGALKGLQRHYFCSACTSEITGYFYRSRVGNINLHPHCVNIPPVIRFSGPNNREVMLMKHKATGRCYFCRERMRNVGGKPTAQIWSYVATDNSYHMHVCCLIGKISGEPRNHGYENTLHLVRTVIQRFPKKFWARDVPRQAGVRLLKALIARLTGFDISVETINEVLDGWMRSYVH